MNKSEIMRVLLCLSRIEGKVVMELDNYLSDELTEVVDMLAKKILPENEDDAPEGQTQGYDEEHQSSVMHGVDNKQ